MIDMKIHFQNQIQYNSSSHARPLSTLL